MGGAGDEGGGKGGTRVGMLGGGTRVEVIRRGGTRAGEVEVMKMRGATARVEVMRVGGVGWK